jgi:ABC-type glycerol-3-phosphate transport system substrate-binding protein
MKIKRCLLAVAVTLAAAACSGDITAPAPSVRAPGSADQSAASVEESTTTTSTTTPTTLDPVEPDPGDTGSTGSGCCKS